MRNALTKPAIAAMIWVAAAGAALAQSATVTGTAGYRERIALPPGAQLEVRLMDVSRMDVAATLVSGQRFAMTGVPQAFSLTYDPAVIDDRMSYVLQAEIHHEGKVWFRTTQAYPVLTRGAGDTVDLMLTRAAAETQAMQWTGRWEVFEIAGRAVIAENPPVLDLTEPGRVGIKGACNSFAGAAAPDGSALRFDGPIAGTMKACPPELEKLDRDLIAALEATDRYERNGDGMAFVNAAGVTVLRLRRVE